MILKPVKILCTLKVQISKKKKKKKKKGKKNLRSPELVMRFLDTMELTLLCKIITHSSYLISYIQNHLLFTKFAGLVVTKVSEILLTLINIC